MCCHSDTFRHLEIIVFLLLFSIKLLQLLAVGQHLLHNFLIKKKKKSVCHIIINISSLTAKKQVQFVEDALRRTSQRERDHKYEPYDKTMMEEHFNDGRELEGGWGVSCWTQHSL